MPYRVSLPPERRLDAFAHTPAASPMPEKPVTPVATGGTPRPTVAKHRPRGAYGYPWPDAIPALGDRHVRPFDLCSNCQAGTWVAYGDTPLCLACAQEKIRDLS
jgi:hypothetical protein